MRNHFTLHRHGDLTRQFSKSAIWFGGALALLYVLNVFCSGWSGTYERGWHTSDGDSDTFHYAVRTSAGVVEDPPGWIREELRRPGMKLSKSPLSFWVHAHRGEWLGDAISSLMLWVAFLGVGIVLGSAGLRELESSTTIVKDRGVLFLEPSGERHRTNNVLARVADESDSEGSSFVVQLQIPGRAPWKVRTFSNEADACELLAEIESFLPERAGPAALEFRPVSRQLPLPVRAAGGECRVCGTGLATQVVGCPRCETPHHADCWEYAGGCSTYACGMRATA